MAKKYKYRHQELYNGVKIDVRADTLSALSDKVIKRKHQIDRSVINSDIKLQDFVEIWRETYKKTSVSNDWYVEIVRISNKIISEVGNKPISKIKPLNIQMFLNSCTNLSNSYLKKIYDVICQIFRLAYKNGITTYDYTLDLNCPKGKSAELGRSLTDKERNVLLKVLEDHRGNLFCKIMLYCGLRPNEVSALIWKDIDFRNEYIEVNKARKKDGSVGQPKSADGIRKVPIPEHFIRELLEHKRAPFDLVCPQVNGKAQTNTTIKGMWKNIKRLMNIEMGAKVFNNQLIPPLPLSEDFKMYYLRHTYCTDLEKAGVPINIARQLMGHSTIELTSKIYTHASTESLDIARGLINTKGTHIGNNALNR